MVFSPGDVRYIAAKHFCGLLSSQMFYFPVSLDIYMIKVIL